MAFAAIRSRCTHPHSSPESRVPLLPLHQAHDYRALIARWRVVGQAAGMRLKVLTVVEGEKIIYLEGARKSGQVGFGYISAGVHGDEAAGPWGLLAWAERSLDLLRSRPFLLFPCLNPHGLLLNTRADHRGLDVNRRFHLLDDDICGPWNRAAAGRVLDFGLCLHEDYDAQGFYVYELSPRSRALSEDIFRACTGVISHDPRRTIEGRLARGGIIRRRKVPPNLPGLPEAVVLHQLGCPLTFTFETPSEFSLDDRVRTQADFISAAIERIGTAEGPAS